MQASWQKRSSLLDNPYNSSNLMWTSAASCTNSSKQYFIMFVRQSDSHPGKPNCAVNAVIDNSMSVAAGADAVADRTGFAASAHNDLFVEQQSAVQGIRELVVLVEVVQFSIVFPMTCLLDCHLTGELLMQFPCSLTILCQLTKLTGCPNLRGRRWSLRSRRWLWSTTLNSGAATLKVSSSLW